MKKGQSKASSLYLFIEPVLEHGSVDDIRAAKQNYWKQYKKEWNKIKYKECKCFKIFLDARELKSVSKAASACHLSPTRFIKQCALAQSKQNAALDKVTVGKIRELLVLYYSDLEMMLALEEHDVSNRFGDQLLKYQSQLEAEILKLLHVSML